tara:strand:- start:1066 stop:1239 length:174 start_codon:yes stop_codon:yes gene_type:complete
MNIETMIYSRNKLVELSHLAKRLQRDAKSMFKTRQERDIAIKRLCKLNNTVEEILNE